MKTIAHPDMLYGRYSEATTTNIFKKQWTRFMNYAEAQEHNRLLWMAVALAGHGTVFTIATLAVVILTGNVFSLFIVACCAMVAVVTVNLAAMSTK